MNAQAAVSTQRLSLLGNMLALFTQAYLGVEHGGGSHRTPGHLKPPGTFSVKHSKTLLCCLGVVHDLKDKTTFLVQITCSLLQPGPRIY